MMNTMQRGFTLLIAVVLSSVVVTVGLALSDIAYKQVILASTAKQSQYAFYAADAALECALYYDQEYDAFNTNPEGLTSLSCNGQTISFSTTGTAPKITTFDVPCAGGGTEATITVYKDDVTEPENKLYASGYNTCNASDPRRIERGLKVSYGGTTPPPYAEASYYSQGYYYTQGSYYSEGYYEGYYYGQGYYQSYYEGYYESYYQGYYQSYYQSYYQGYYQSYYEGYYYGQGYYQGYYQSYYEGYYYTEGYYQGYYYGQGYYQSSYYAEGYYEGYYYAQIYYK